VRVHNLARAARLRRNLNRNLFVEDEADGTARQRRDALKKKKDVLARRREKEHRETRALSEWRGSREKPQNIPR
jgi:hypothetical protein